MNQPMKMSQYQQQISRLQNAGAMQGMPNMNQFQQQILQQQQLKAYQMAMSSQQMMGAPGQFPFQHPGMMKQAQHNMMQHQQQQANMQNLQAQMGQINQQMQNQFMQQQQQQQQQQMQNQKAQQTQNQNQAMEMVQNQVNQGIPHMQNPTQTQQQQQQPSSTNPSTANTTVQTPNIDAQSLNKSTSNSSFGHNQDPGQPMIPNTNPMMQQAQQHSATQTQQQMMQNAGFQMPYGNQQFPMNFPLQGAPISATASTTQLNIQQQGQQPQQMPQQNAMQQQQNHQQTAPIQQPNQTQQQLTQKLVHQAQLQAAQLQKQLKNKKQTKQKNNLSKQQAHGQVTKGHNQQQQQQQISPQQPTQNNPLSPVPQTPTTPAMPTPQAPPPQPPPPPSQPTQPQQISPQPTTPNPPSIPSQQTPAQQQQQTTAPPPAIPPQTQSHTKKNKSQQQLPKRRTKKHSAPTENPEPTISEVIPESPIQPPLQMSQDEIQLITKAIQSMGEDKYESYFRVFGCSFKRKENTIENFLSYFSTHVYKTLPTPVKFATDLAEQFKLQTNVYMLLMNPPCPLVFSPLKPYKIQYQLTHCCPKGAEFNLLKPAKRGDAIAYGVFISLFEMVPPVPINVDKEDILPCNFGDQSSYYPIQLSNKTKITIKFPPSIGSQIKWFILMYATKKPPIEVLHVLMDRANFPRNEADKIIASTPQCQGCSFDPIPVIEQASNGIATCPLCGKNVVLSELVLIKKQCMKNLIGQSCGPTPAIPQSGSLQQIAAQKAQQATPKIEPVEENPEEEKLISILADQIAVCVRPKPESSGWTKAIDVEPIESKMAEKPFYATSFDDFMKGMDEIDDDFF